MDIPPVVASVLKVAAPTLLKGLLPPPFGLIASAAVTPWLAQFLPDGEAPAAQLPNGRAALSNEQIVQIVAKHESDPNLREVLQKAELELKRIEAELPFKFEQLAQLDRSDARKSALDTGLAPAIFEVGKTILWNDRVLAYIMTGGGLGLLVASGFFRIQIDPILSNAIFTIIGVVIGRQASRADQVSGFYFGSSSSSQSKDQTIKDALQGLAEPLGKGVGPVAAPPVVVVPPAPPALPAALPGRPARPVAPTRGVAGLSPVQLAALARPHNRFPGSVVWRLTADGISTGGAAHRTVGEPETVREIWREYGPLILSAGKKWNVPVELIVATVATESHGDPNAHRVEPDRRESGGLMQTLTDTAGDMLGRPVDVKELFDPALSLDAGTAYIAHQRPKTGLDPILVAAAYNAGGIRQAQSPRNPWRLVCWPAETGKHCTEFARWFGDAMRESRVAGWADEGEAPSFATAFTGEAMA